MSPCIMDRRQAIKTFGAVIGSLIGTVTVEDIAEASASSSLTKPAANGLPTWSDALLCVNLIVSTRGATRTRQAHTIDVLQDALRFAQPYPPMELEALSRQIAEACEAATCQHCHGFGDWRERHPYPWETYLFCRGTGWKPGT